MIIDVALWNFNWKLFLTVQQEISLADEKTYPASKIAESKRRIEKTKER